MLRRYQGLRLLSLICTALLGCQPTAEMSTSPGKTVPLMTSDQSQAELVVPKPPLESVPESRHLIRFEERAAASSVEFIYRNGEESGQLAILESLGGGVGMIDYDQDGNLDLFFPGGGSFAEDASPLGHRGALFRQTAPWQFLLATDPAGVASEAHYTHGAAAADADNDGFPDLLITGYSGLEYFRNNGDGTFTESAEAVGLNDRLWSSSAAWGDLNADGIPDVYVTHYVNWSPGNHPSCQSVRGDRPDVCPPKRFDALPDTLYFGVGDGTFSDSTSEAGLSPLGKGLGVVIADVDWDGRQDVYVANDTVPNLMYHNRGEGRLENVSEASGTAVNDQGLPDGSMGVDVGDFNLDGLPDLWVSNYERESFALYRNFGSGIFRHVSQATGITAVGPRFVGWGTVFFDMDADGDEDVFVSNGHVVHFPNAAPVHQTPFVFENMAGNHFENRAAHTGAWTASPHPGRGCAVGDLDHDGDLDLAVSLVNEPVALLCNETPPDHHWLQIRLIGTVSCRDALGARVTIQTESGRQIRQVKGGGSYASTGDVWLHFGLAKAEQVTSLEILWPSGMTQTLTEVAVDRRHLLHEPSHDLVTAP